MSAFILLLSFLLSFQLSLFSWVPFHTVDLSIPKEPFIFVRHGSTDWHVSKLSLGPKNYELNERGLKEAQLAAKVIVHAVYRLNAKNENFVMISSPLKRALGTADTISSHIGIPVMVKPGLEERYFGDFRLQKCFRKETLSFVPIDAESDKSFYSRVSLALKQIFEDEKTKRSIKILVSHGRVFQFLSKNLTHQEKVVPRGSVVLFTPNDHNSWSLHLLPED